jgi:hypothetical protein
VKQIGGIDAIADSDISEKQTGERAGYQGEQNDHCSPEIDRLVAVEDMNQPEGDSGGVKQDREFGVDYRLFKCPGKNNSSR